MESFKTPAGVVSALSGGGLILMTTYLIRRLNGLEKTLNDNFDKVNEKISGCQRRLSRLEMDMENVLSSLSTTRSQIDKISRLLDGSNQQIRSAQNPAKSNIELPSKLSVSRQGVSQNEIVYPTLHYNATTRKDLSSNSYESNDDFDQNLSQSYQENTSTFDEEITENDITKLATALDNC